MTHKAVIGFISVSDRASQGEYEDKGIPALSEWMSKVLISPYETHEKIIPDNREIIEKTLIEFSDIFLCDLIFTTGGTGPARRDVTPEATLAVATKEMQGFGEQMRRISLNFVPTAILSRQTAVIRETENHASLIVNLPGQPRAITEILGGLKNDENEQIVHGIFSAIPYCLELIGGPVIECNENLCKVWRPKKYSS